MDEHDEIIRLYGPWRARTPDDVVRLLDGYAGTWWIAGGWAIEAFTGTSRPHGDVDPSIPRGDVARLLRHLEGRLDVWAAEAGVLRVLSIPVEECLTRSCENLWLRASGADPWEYDVILMDAPDSTWTWKRDDRISRPLTDILWRREGVPYLTPEVQLLHKSRRLRPQDQQDFDACLPLLDAVSREWLADALAITQPEHPWLTSL